MRTFQMKYALIMGASGDIGHAIVKDLAKKGWSLYLHYNQNEEAIDQQLKKLWAAYPKQDFFKCQLDLCQTDKMPSFLENIFQLDAIVFASGQTYYSFLKEMKSEQLEALWQVHLKAPMLLLQGLESKLAAHHQGRVVFISSIYGSVGSALEVAYSTVKGGQQAFVNAYAREVAGLGITVNAIAPGAVDTKMNTQLDADSRELLENEIPLQRLAHPDEISYWVNALLEKKAQYLTGQTVTVSGGWLK